MERFEEHIRAEARALQRADAVLNFYGRILTSADIAHDGFETVALDLLADVRHFCMERDLDFTSLVKRATEHFEIECGIRPGEGLEEGAECALCGRGDAPPTGPGDSSPRAIAVAGAEQAPVESGVVPVAE
jgi:hypothetical protein